MRCLSLAVVIVMAAVATGQGGSWPGIEALPSSPSTDPAVQHEDANSSSSYALNQSTVPVEDQQLPGGVQPVVDIWEATIGSGIEEFRGYRHESSATEWILGDGDQFGMFSFVFGTAFHRRGIANGFATGFQWHLFAGPAHVDVPPRVYDFLLGYQNRDWIGTFGYDISAMVSASSDFAGSARDGIRFPSHAVGFLRLASNLELVFGVDYIDREDVRILPVGGLILRPTDAIRLQFVFPRPRIDLALNQTHRLYVSGELGGGEWAIRRDISLVNDLFTYSDLRIAIGLEGTEATDVSGFEIAWIFKRQIEFLVGPGNAELDDTVMLRFVRSH
jgi:hypothetical protein